MKRITPTIKPTKTKSATASNDQSVSFAQDEARLLLDAIHALQFNMANAKCHGHTTEAMRKVARDEMDKLYAVRKKIAVAAGFTLP